METLGIWKADYIYGKKNLYTSGPMQFRLTDCLRVKGTWGSSLDSDFESVIVHFLRGSFIVSILPTVFLKGFLSPLLGFAETARLIVT